MRPEVLRKIRDLVKAGATVLGPPPSRSPSMENYPRVRCGSERARRRAVGRSDTDTARRTRARQGPGRLGQVVGRGSGMLGRLILKAPPRCASLIASGRQGHLLRRQPEIRASHYHRRVSRRKPSAGIVVAGFRGARAAGGVRGCQEPGAPAVVARAERLSICRVPGSSVPGGGAHRGGHARRPRSAHHPDERARRPERQAAATPTTSRSPLG